MSGGLHDPVETSRQQLDRQMTVQSLENAWPCLAECQHTGVSLPERPTQHRELLALLISADSHAQPPPALERIRNERGPFASDDDLLLAAFYDVREYGALKAAGPIDTAYSLGATPLVTLVKEIAARSDIKSVRIMGRNVGDRGL